MFVRTLLPPSRRFVTTVAVLAAIGAVGAFGAASVLAASTQVAPTVGESNPVAVASGNELEPDYTINEPRTGGHSHGGCNWGGGMWD